MEIHWQKVESIDATEQRAVEERIRSLAEGHSDLIDIRISGKETRHHRHGEQTIRIVCQARGKELVVVRTTPDLGTALNEAVDVFEREVRRLRSRRTARRDERTAQPPLLGIVDRVLRDRDYGFILTDSGEQVYFHRNSVRGDLEFDALEEGERVGLNVEGGRDGPQATSVVPAPPGTPVP